jgi:hypothetical protein
VAGAVSFPRVLVAIPVLACTSACAEVRAGHAEPPRYEPADQSTTRAAKSSARPLVLEWPAADRAALEAQRAKGIVVVRYAQHEMEVLRGCRAGASYRYASITPKEEGLVFHTEDELDAAMPIHAVRLEAKLKEKKALSVGMTIVGMYESDARTWRGADLQGDCAGATHVVRALAVGAFEISASAATSAGLTTTAPLAAVDAAHDEGREVLHRDGTKGACAKASPRDAAPPYDCGAPLRIEVAVIQFDRSAGAASARPSVPGPGGCGEGLVPKGGGCEAVNPDRPPLLDVLTPAK